MRVKDAVVTFVAMGGFAMPVVFQNPGNSGSGSTQPVAAALTAGLTPDDEPTKTKKA